MSLKIEYDHSNLHMKNLHPLGIRSTKDLEEVVEGVSFCQLDEETFDFPVYIFTGFSHETKGIEVALTVDKHGKYVTLDVIIPSPKEFLNKICKLKR